MCSPMGKWVKHCPEWGRSFFPTSSRPCRHFGQNGCSFWELSFDVFVIPDSQISRFMDFQIPGFPDSRLSAGMSRGQLAWGAIWTRKCWFSIVNIDVWVCDLLFRREQESPSIVFSNQNKRRAPAPTFQGPFNNPVRTPHRKLCLGNNWSQQGRLRRFDRWVHWERGRLGSERIKLLKKENTPSACWHG